MVKKQVRQAIFFIIIFLIFVLGCKTVHYWEQRDMNSEAAKILVGIIATLIIVAVYYLAKLNNSSENFWDVSDGAQCAGGPFFWQTDSPMYNKCRELASTKEGRCYLSSYNCPNGYVGQPRSPFYYSPISDDNYKNERCTDKPVLTCQDQGLCSMEKQMYEINN